MCSTIAEQPKLTFQIRLFHSVTWSLCFQTITLLYTAVLFVEKLIAVSVCVYMTSVVQVCIHNTLILCSCLFVLLKPDCHQGFFSSAVNSLRFFPWHFVWAHKCLNLVSCCVLIVIIIWSLAISLAVTICFICHHHSCINFTVRVF